MKFYIPSLKSSEAAEQLKATILTSEPEASININVGQKIMTVESKASPETFRQLITITGHQAELQK